MGTFNPEHFKDVIGEKIIFEGHPATIIDFVSCYEGDFWRIKIEGVYPPDQSVPYYTPPGEIIKRKLQESEKKEKRTSNHCTWKDSPLPLKTISLM